MRDRPVPLTRNVPAGMVAENERFLDVRRADVAPQIRSVADDGDLKKHRSVRAPVTYDGTGYDAQSLSRDIRSIGPTGTELRNARISCPDSAGGDGDD